ncbi:hypothetical protein QYM36_012342 [Artemia franciscana]|uniref:Uncharacterized protein n=2 Tax=Artemia franciscana TaxID=6661 RepID=A0AA88HSL1_ARTSF|nr:hypothetical protein QYM36_012342 [Artemia franciscana]KAK2711136.1 hypothetical protein QYM36_012342 [Artemia franciscana]
MNKWFIDGTNGVGSLGFEEYRNMVERNNWGEITDYNILIEEVWNSTTVDRTFPNKPKAVTILRNPVEQFESVFYYMDLREFYNVSTFKELVSQISSNTVRNDHLDNVHGRNQLLRNLGFNPNKDRSLRDFISELNATFDLVMIAEHFEESVVQLRNLIGVPLEYMTYLPQNTRHKEAVYKISKTERKVLENWLKLDMEAYKAFKWDLMRKITADDKIQRQKLRNLNKHLRDKCKISEGRQKRNFTNFRFGVLDVKFLYNKERNIFCDHFADPGRNKFQQIQRSHSEALRHFRWD